MLDVDTNAQIDKISNRTRQAADPMSLLTITKLKVEDGRAVHFQYDDAQFVPLAHYHTRSRVDKAPFRRHGSEKHLDTDRQQQALLR